MGLIVASTEQEHASTQRIENETRSLQTRWRRRDGSQRVPARGRGERKNVRGAGVVERVHERIGLVRPGVVEELIRQRTVGRGTSLGPRRIRDRVEAAPAPG